MLPRYGGEGCSVSNLTKRAIIQTFEEMLRKYPFDKITVSALAANCGISSNTFYYHFRDIYDLLDTWLDGKLSAYPTDYLTDAWKEAIKRQLHRVQDNPDIVGHVLHSISRERLEHYVFTTLEPSVHRMVMNRIAGRDLPEGAAILSGAFCYTLLGHILKFIWGGMKGDIDATFDPIIDFLDHGVTTYVRLKCGEKPE